MKRVIWILFLLSAHFSMLKAQWVEQQTNQTNMIVTEFSPAGDNVNWALDLNWPNRSTFSKTVDGGQHWVTGNFNLNTTSSYRIRSIYALNADTAWIPVIFDTELSKSGVYKTADGGLSWIQQPTSYSTNNPGKFPSLVYFWNASEGVTVGSIDTTTMRFDIFVTSDGGTTWNQVPDVDNPPSTLEDYRLPPLSYRRFRVVGNTIWFITIKNNIYKSIDKGYHWERYNTPAKSDYSNLADCVFAFKDENNGLMVDSYQNAPYKYTLYETNDGAQTWHEKTHQGIPYGWDINFVPGTTGTYVASGYTHSSESSGLCYTEDGGATWIKHPSFEGLATGAVIFPNSITGWIGSEEGRVYHTQNFIGENPFINQRSFTGKSKVDALFNHELDHASMLDTSNYVLMRYGNSNRFYFASADIDSVNPALVHLTLKNPVTSGSKFWFIPSKNIRDTNGFHLISIGYHNEILYEAKKAIFLLSDAATPLEGVKIGVVDSRQLKDTVFQVTDSTGNSKFQIDPGNYSYFISKQGYHDTTGIITITQADSSLFIPIMLTPYNGTDDRIYFRPISIYPNPASCFVYFADESEAVVQVLNLSGTLVKTIAKPRRIKEISISDLREGMYIFKVKQQTGETCFKIQVKK
ncbi:MAG: T9SS type A sorting domain-containing protein [Bacteroidota bacterium]